MSVKTIQKHLKVLSKFANFIFLLTDPPDRSPHVAVLEQGREAPRAARTPVAKKPWAHRATRPEARPGSKTIHPVAPTSQKRPLSPDPPLSKKARTALTISARRKSRSPHPPNRSKKSSDVPIAANTDDQIGQALKRGWGPRKATRSGYPRRCTSPSFRRGGRLSFRADHLGRSLLVWALY